MSGSYARDDVQAVFVASNQRGREQIVGAIGIINVGVGSGIIREESRDVVVEFQIAGVSRTLDTLASDDETVADGQKFRNSQCREITRFGRVHVRSGVCNQIGDC